MNTLAIDIGGTKLSMALFDDPASRIILREVRATDREGGRDWMLANIAEIAGAWREQIALDRCAVGFGGPVNVDRRSVAFSTHVRGWSEFPLAFHLESLLGVPTVMDNDANVGALGEATFGAGRGARPLFYMTLSTGIGGGIILEDGTLYRGADSYAGELGHVTIRPDGPECLCGSRGCFERLCSGLWLERDYGKPAGELLQDPKFVFSYVVDLAMGLKTAIMILNPKRLVIGGGISKAGEKLFGPLRTELRRQVTDWSRARLDVVPAELGSDSVLWGALALARL